MAYSSQTYTFLILALALLPLAVLEVNALNYASLKSDDNFELKWTYDNGKLMFKMKCKGNGWCGVGFSNAAQGDGKGMKDYDIAVGGVASSTPYLADYWSAGLGAPAEDMAQNLTLVNATEVGGYTNVEFYRHAMTGDPKDVQFMNDTEVFVMWGLNSDKDANVALTDKHGPKDIIVGKHNLIMLAMTATPPPPSTTKPTTSGAGSRFVANVIILALSACVLSF